MLNRYMLVGSMLDRMGTLLVAMIETSVHVGFMNTIDECEWVSAGRLVLLLLLDYFRPRVE